MAMKKKISKEELRKVTLEAKKKHSAIKKIESPLAKYNKLDQLTCIICKLVVRNEAVWPVHLNSKIHKDNIALARETKLQTPAQTITSNKRPAAFQEPQSHKKIKGILKNTGQSSSSEKSLPADFFDNPVTTNNTTVAKIVPLNGTNGTKETSVEEKENEGKDGKDLTNKSNLPEGFFDDPVQDAKARNVEYRDPNDEEWERFQREIKEESVQSAQIIGEEQEEAATERQLDVIEEQLRNWSKVMDFEKKIERVKTVEKKQDMKDKQDESSSEDEDFDEFIDWRQKSSFRQ